MKRLSIRRPKVNKRTQAAARKWVAALRSGEYTQLVGDFHAISEDSAGNPTPQHCCLAVAENVLVAKHEDLCESPLSRVESIRRKTPYGGLEVRNVVVDALDEEDGSNGYGSKTMARKLGMSLDLAEYFVAHNDGRDSYKKKSYAWIARRIEELWELK